MVAGRETSNDDVEVGTDLVDEVVTALGVTRRPFFDIFCCFRRRSIAIAAAFILEASVPLTKAKAYGFLARLTAN